MAVSRYYTIGAVTPDAPSFKALADRLEGLDMVSSDPTVVLARRRDRNVVRAVLPEARVEGVETGLSRVQWLEFSSAFFSASTVSFLMGAVHLWTGLVVQAVLTLAAVIGLVLYHRRPRIGKKLLRFGMPEKLADGWQAAFPNGFALVLVTVREEDYDEAQSVFLEDDALLAPLAVDRRPVI